ncbi:fatty acid desaturase [Myxococcota bacterium]|nr:fatty acid desaturase [Myxococcota bacterium]
MRAFPALTDPRTPTAPGPGDQLSAALLNDPRDRPFLTLILQCLGVAALGLGLFFVTEHFWLFAAGYWAILFLGVIDRFTLMLHCTSHRVLFKPRARVLNKVIPFVLSPFMGQSPDTYFTHHVGMHHPENNLESDLSTTMPYQRDRFTHWLRYFSSFFFFGVFQLAGYFFRKGQARMGWRALLGELSFITFVVVMSLFVDARATFAVFVVPLVVMRILMMAGNWAQHAFIDRRDPNNAYWNSITCINTRYNRRCFNDGYHIHHHVAARCHFSEYPAELERNLATYAEHDAVIFEGIDFFQVWVYLMLGRYRALARHFVQLPGAPVRSEAEIITFLRSRTERLGVEAR